MNLFAQLMAIEVDRRAALFFMLVGCTNCVVRCVTQIPLKDVLDWAAETNHYCLPLSVTKVMDKAEIKKLTTYNSPYAKDSTQ